MRVSRVIYIAVLILVGLVLQVSVMPRLGLPGAVPDILLLVVVGIAMTYGPTAGCATGFTAGLVEDLAPPADHAAGRYALVLCLVGYGAGLFMTRYRRSFFSPVMVVAVAAAASTLLYAGVGVLVGDHGAQHVGLAQLVLTAVLYDAVLAPFVVPLVMAGARRIDPQPVLPL